MEKEIISIIEKDNKLKIPDEIISYLGIQKEIIVDHRNKKTYLEKP